MELIIGLITGLSGLYLLLVVSTVGLGYMLPGIIALAGNRENQWFIFMMNILFGWLPFMWLVLFVFAIVNKQVQKSVNVNIQYETQQSI